jgi:hypothetical protein
MGVCNSTNQTAVEKEERTKARQIESQLKQDRKDYDSEVKLLLLGTFINPSKLLLYKQRAFKR